MFELDDKIVESIIFSMENQGAVSFIDVETGELSSEGGDSGVIDESAYRASASYEPIPVWTSQDGYRLMEQFAQTIGNPEARSELLAALSRGRGVFRAFKNALDARPEVEKKWYEYKERAMKARIVRWYEDLRDARGLERLGLEPEDTDELLLSDFQMSCCAPEARSDLESMFRAGQEDALGRFPEAFVIYEFESLKQELRGARASEFSVYTAECESGICAGMAIVRTLLAADRAFGRLVFLYVDPQRRRIGLGRRLVEFSRESLESRGVRHFFVDIPFLWQEFGASLESLGYKPFGTRWMVCSDV